MKIKNDLQKQKIIHNNKYNTNKRKNKTLTTSQMGFHSNKYDNRVEEMV